MLRQASTPIVKWIASRGGLLALGATLVLAAPPRAEAQPVKVVIVPTGQGPALEPSAAVAQALKVRLSKSRKRQVRLAYFSPETPPPPKPAKAQEAKATKLLKKAHAAYELMEYDKVKSQAGDALKTFKALLKSGYATPGYVQTQQLLAASALQEGDNKAAFKAMNDAILFDPQPPSKKLFNPSVQELYEQVRAEAPARGTIALSSTPPALVWFNEELHGLATGKVSLRTGLYLVRFFAPGHAPLIRWLRVKAHEERSLAPTLQPDELPENEVLGKLREEGKGNEPGTAVSQAMLDLSADELIIVNGGKGCTSTRCNVYLHWAKEGRWDRHRQAVYQAGQAAQAAAALMGAKLTTTVAQPQNPTPPQDPVVSSGDRSCTLDSQCFMNERCKNGRCVLPRPVTRTWWFWTLMTAAAAGVTLAIVLPLTGPERPMIEVR